MKSVVTQLIPTCTQSVNRKICHRLILNSINRCLRRAFSIKTGPSTATTAASSSKLTRFLGASGPITHTLSFAYPPTEAIPCYRVLNPDGKLVDGYKIPTGLDSLTLIRMYECMVHLNVMDAIFYDAQRQGRISFYMTSFGEEGTHIGSAAALQPTDVIYAQYRETGILLWRGWPIEQFAHQCFSNAADLGKGRQMPVHYGDSSIHFQTISSPLGTQLPQAVGAAYAMKREGNGRCVICYFGEGAASEGDFHPALNMSATLKTPVLFFVRNNGYAISTPSSEQYRGDGIAGRGAGYGITTIRVDGNDTLAVYETVKAARELAVKESRPILIEAMTYRGGHHSTSDDSTRYRSVKEINWWLENESPIVRFRMLLENQHLWDSHKETEIRRSARKKVLDAMKIGETTKKPPVSAMLSDVYHTMPQHLIEQQEELMEHLKEWGDKYQLDAFASESEWTEPPRKQQVASVSPKSLSTT